MDPGRAAAAALRTHQMFSGMAAQLHQWSEGASLVAYWSENSARQRWCLAVITVAGLWAARLC
eukprot:5526114-Prorocentrum_lima.AAC.1